MFLEKSKLSYYFSLNTSVVTYNDKHFFSLTIQPLLQITKLIIIPCHHLMSSLYSKFPVLSQKYFLTVDVFKSGSKVRK